MAAVAPHDSKPGPDWAQCLKARPILTLADLTETTMEIKKVILIMFVVFALFVLANWLNRPRK